MEEGLAQAQMHPGSIDLPAWKTIVSVTSAVLLALVFLVAGIWKITEPYDAATRMSQAKIPGDIALPTAIAFGIAETFGAVLLLVPRFRRWGAWLTGAMLIAFMIYVGYYYDVLRGAECSCFPFIKRAVGPGFFIGDAIFLALAVAAGWWARPSDGKRTAGIILGAVTVFALASFGITYARQSGVKAPSTITVNGEFYSLQQGKHFLYFFDPECSHCYFAAKTMSGFEWQDAKVIAIPTRQQEFAESFLKDTGLKALVSKDVEPLKAVFPFGDPPYGVALEHGRQVQAFPIFEGSEPSSGLKKLGFIK